MAGSEGHIKPLRLFDLAQQGLQPTEEERLSGVRQNTFTKKESQHLMQEIETHLSEDLVWAAIKKQQPLGSKEIEHTRVCRDCRDCVQELAREAETEGLSFPDLLSQAV